jgi:hypothetical protein
MMAFTRGVRTAAGVLKLLIIIRNWLAGQSSSQLLLDTGNGERRASGPTISRPKASLDIFFIPTLLTTAIRKYTIKSMIQ